MNRVPYKLSPVARPLLLWALAAAVTVGIASPAAAAPTATDTVTSLHHQGADKSAAHKLVTAQTKLNKLQALHQSAHQATTVAETTVTTAQGRGDDASAAVTRASADVDTARALLGPFVNDNDTLTVMKAVAGVAPNKAPAVLEAAQSSPGRRGVLAQRNGALMASQRDATTATAALASAQAELRTAQNLEADAQSRVDQQTAVVANLQADVRNQVLGTQSDSISHTDKAERVRRAQEKKRKAAAAAERALLRGHIPVRGAVVGSKFGSTGIWARYHTGIDFRAGSGTPIYAVQAGTVTYAGNTGNWAGNHVVISHVSGWVTQSAHMSRIAAHEGDQVKAGDVIGYVGSTGRAFGAHLHFELYPAGADTNDVYAAIDPKPWLARIGGLGRAPSGHFPLRSTAPSVPLADGRDPRTLAKSILTSRYGYNDDEFACFDYIINRESGWNSQAENKKSGAYGIPQALPGTKMASVAPDWRTNPSTQIIWGVNYMKSRYGSPCEAKVFKAKHGWY